MAAWGWVRLGGIPGGSGPAVRVGSSGAAFLPPSNGKGPATSLGHLLLPPLRSAPRKSEGVTGVRPLPMHTAAMGSGVPALPGLRLLGPIVAVETTCRGQGGDSSQRWDPRRPGGLHQGGVTWMEAPVVGQLIRPPRAVSLAPGTVPGTWQEPNKHLLSPHHPPRRGTARGRGPGSSCCCRPGPSGLSPSPGAPSPRGCFGSCVPAGLELGLLGPLPSLPCRPGTPPSARL
ncbi:translation initiation factor IF-2-like isoform X2 [Lemur catta]|uniref:translation initiation factor IF-2-like isoform X2 n=1 Tax=Lemur catta TaxID=9447 RepID=UPI001E26788A|nr:translation initiation factor IF-2-like isoform X2 [Lemur catta]